jgi:hypothetical protein
VGGVVDSFQFPVSSFQFPVSSLREWYSFAGCWLLAAGCWLLAAGCWLLAFRFPDSLSFLFSFDPGSAETIRDEASFSTL